jgi:hypothetical protein
MIGVTHADQLESSDSDQLLRTFLSGSLSVDDFLGDLNHITDGSTIGYFYGC